MGSVSAISGPDTELQVPDEILQKIGMKTSFSKDVPKLSNISVDHLQVLRRMFGFFEPREMLRSLAARGMYCLKLV